MKIKISNAIFSFVPPFIGEKKTSEVCSFGSAQRVENGELVTLESANWGRSRPIDCSRIGAISVYCTSETGASGTIVPGAIYYDANNNVIGYKYQESSSPSSVRELKTYAPPSGAVKVVLQTNLTNLTDDNTITFI